MEDKVKIEAQIKQLIHLKEGLEKTIKVKEDLEKTIKAQELNDKLAKFKKDLEGKIIVTNNKSVTNHKGSLVLIYHESIYLNKGTIYFKGRSVTAIYKNYNILSNIETRIHGKEFSSDIVRDYKTTELQYTSLDIFEKLEAIANGVIKDIIDLAFVKSTLAQDGLEQQRSKLVKTQKELLDIPHIELTERQVWKLRSTIFLIENLFILTPNSIKWLEDWYSGETEMNSFRHEYLTSAEYTYLGNSQAEATVVYNLIKEAYNALTKKGE